MNSYSVTIYFEPDPTSDAAATLDRGQHRRRLRRQGRIMIRTDGKPTIANRPRRVGCRSFGVSKPGPCPSLRRWLRQVSRESMGRIG